ncbi:MAG TPA: hypothetical protein PLS34_01095 [Gammaproteobacteria bacterium]|nr:hypothetical protein [Gammaproteobacteria bacterium]
MKLLERLSAWLAATLVTAVTGSIVQTQFNLAAIAKLGAPVPIALRLQTTLQDLAGFAPMLAAVAGAGLLVALPVAAWLGRRLARPVLLYTLAGAAVIAVAILLMNGVLPVTAIAATRSMAGFLALTACGALGGWTFSRLAPQRRSAMA